MRTTNRRRPLLIAGMVSLTTVVPGLAAAEEATAGKLEEVLVTATRRETTIREAPVSVSSFGAEQLQNRQIEDVGDIAALVPSMQFDTTHGDTRITIRGIGNNNLTGGADPGVAYHLDGVYIGAGGPAGSSFFDVERVEVLRGPQGTLFGRNATGGSVNVIPQRPDAAPSGALAVTVGANPFQTRVDSFINGPLDGEGALTGRLSVQRSYNEGNSKNRADIGPERLDDDDSYAARGQLSWEPSSSFRSHVSIEYHRTDNTGPAYQLVGGPGFEQTPAEALGGHRPDPNSRDVYADIGDNKGDFFFQTLDAAVDVGPGTLKALFSNGRVTMNQLYDDDGTEIDFIHGTALGDTRQQYGELLYEVGFGEKLDLIVGANVYRQDYRGTFIVPVLIIAPLFVEIHSNVDTRSHAGFAHLDYHVTDALEVFGGLRYTQDKKSIDESNSFVGAAQQQEDWGKVTYEVGTSLKLSDTVNVYAKHSTGFKGGGYQGGNLTPAFDPETNASTEVGLKGLFFDRSLELNLSAFHMDYDNLQLSQVREDGLSAMITNAAQAKVKGVEAELIWQATAELRAEFVGSYLDAEFLEFLTADSANPELGVQDLSGNQLPDAPRGAVSASLYYSKPVFGAGTGTLGARYYWQDKKYFNEFNVPESSQDAVGRVDLSAEFESDSGLWHATLAVRNATDEVVRNAVFINTALAGSPSLATLDPGRVVSLYVRRNFN